MWQGWLRWGERRVDASIVIGSLQPNTFGLKGNWLTQISTNEIAPIALAMSMCYVVFSRKRMAFVLDA